MSDPKTDAWQLYADAVQASAASQLCEQRKALREGFERLARMDVEEPIQILAEPKTNQNMKPVYPQIDALLEAMWQNSPERQPLQIGRKSYNSQRSAFIRKYREAVERAAIQPL